MSPPIASRARPRNTAAPSSCLSIPGSAGTECLIFRGAISRRSTHDLRDTPYQANRTLGVLSKMFNLAELWDLRPDGSNPCRHVKRFREEKRERFLSDIEYQRLGAALKEIEVDGSETASAIAAVRLLMLTGCRLSEIQKLRWEHVDLEAGELRLRVSKTGAKVVYLGDPAIAVLERIDRRDDNPWVIAGRKPGKSSYRPATSLAAYPRARAGLTTCGFTT